MGNIEINASSTVCRKCGTAYSRLKGYFPISYGFLYKGTGYMPYCRDCIDTMFNNYLKECEDVKTAVRQMCRKLDIYWNERLFDEAERRSSSRSVMTNYISKSTNSKTANKSYDDTLREEGVLWVLPSKYQTSSSQDPIVTADIKTQINTANEIEEDIDPDIIAFWGPGNNSKTYNDLQQRYEYWKEHLPNGVDVTDIGVQALLRQICGLEIEINLCRASGKPTDKLINTLNTVLGSAKLKPDQKREEAVDQSYDNTPLGVWLYKYEYQRPLPELDEEFKDVNGIRRYISTWVRGHLAKMIGIKNSYSQMYEDAIKELSVERPEYDGEDDEALIYNAFSDSGDDFE